MEAGFWASSSPFIIFYAHVICDLSVQKKKCSEYAAQERKTVSVLNLAWLHDNVASSREVKASISYLFLYLPFFFKKTFLFMLYLLMLISGTMMPMMPLYHPGLSLCFPSLACPVSLLRTSGFSLLVFDSRADSRLLCFRCRRPSLPVSLGDMT